MYVCMYGRAWIGLLAEDFVPRKPRFNSSAVHVGFVVNEVTLGRIFLRAFTFSLADCRSTDASYSSIVRGM
jgi:hypothetical protein